MSRYRKLVNSIREKSFQEIKGKIWIIQIPFSIPGAAALWILPNVSLLIFTNKCKKLKRKVLIGLLAHELSHFVLFQRKNWIDFWKLFLFGGKEKAIIEERKTDRLAIEKGYGKELIATKKEAKKRLVGTKYEKRLDNYLSIEETKRYHNKVKRDKKSQ